MGGLLRKVRTSPWLPRAAQATGIALFLGIHTISLGALGPWPWMWGLGFALLALWSPGFSLAVAVATVCGLWAVRLLPPFAWAWLAVFLLLVFGGGLLALVRRGYRLLPGLSSRVAPALLILLAPSGLEVGLLPAVMLLAGLLFGMGRGTAVAAVAFLWTVTVSLWQGTVPSWSGLLVRTVPVPPCHAVTMGWAAIPLATRRAWQQVATLVACHLGPASPLWRASYLALGREGLFLLSLAVAGALLRRSRPTLAWIPALYWLAGTLVLERGNGAGPSGASWLAGITGTAGTFLAVTLLRREEPRRLRVGKTGRETSS